MIRLSDFGRRCASTLRWWASRCRIWRSEFVNDGVEPGTLEDFLCVHAACLLRHRHCVMVRIVRSGHGHAGIAICGCGECGVTSQVRLVRPDDRAAADWAFQVAIGSRHCEVLTHADGSPNLPLIEALQVALVDVVQDAYVEYMGRASGGNGP